MTKERIKTLLALYKEFTLYIKNKYSDYDEIAFIKKYADMNWFEILDLIESESVNGR